MAIGYQVYRYNYPNGRYRYHYAPRVVSNFDHTKIRTPLAIDANDRPKKTRPTNKREPDQSQRTHQHSGGAAGKDSASQRPEAVRKRSRLRSGARGLVVVVVVAFVFVAPLFFLFMFICYQGCTTTFLFLPLRQPQHNSTKYATTSDGPRGWIPPASD